MPGVPAPLQRGHPGPHAHGVRGAAAKQDGRPHRPLADDIQAASTSAQAKRLQKERDKLTKQLDELRRFDEQLRHYADQRIQLDLDDGVKVNYGKFGDLLAEVKTVTGRRSGE